MAQCIVIGPVCLQRVGGRAVFVGGSVTKITRNCMHWSLPKWFVGKGGDHLQLIKFWPSRDPGSAAGRKLLAPSYYSQHAVFASLWALFSFLLLSVSVTIINNLDFSYFFNKHIILCIVYSIVSHFVVHCWRSYRHECPHWTGSRIWYLWWGPPSCLVWVIGAWLPVSVPIILFILWHWWSRTAHGKNTFISCTCLFHSTFSKFSLLIACHSHRPNDFFVWKSTPHSSVVSAILPAYKSNWII